MAVTRRRIGPAQGASRCHRLLQKSPILVTAQLKLSLRNTLSAEQTRSWSSTQTQACASKKPFGGQRSRCKRRTMARATPKRRGQSCLSQLHSANPSLHWKTRRPCPAVPANRSNTFSPYNAHVAGSGRNRSRVSSLLSTVVRCTPEAGRLPPGQVTQHAITPTCEHRFPTSTERSIKCRAC